MTTDHLNVPPAPGYLPPVSLREAIDAGLDLTVMDADTVGEILAGRAAPRSEQWRAMISMALAGEYATLHGEVVFPPMDEADGTYTIAWPRQDLLDAWQYEADLADDPDLAPLVLARLTDGQRRTIQLHMADAEHRREGAAVAEEATDDELVACARALAIWALKTADQPGMAALRFLGTEMATASSDRAVRELRQFFADPELWR